MLQDRTIYKVNKVSKLKTTIHKLIMKIWDEDTLPTEWVEGIICPIYKKRDRMICSNYRPFTLLNVVYKISSILINNRLTKIVENKLEDCQMGFRPTDPQSTTYL